MNKIDKKTNIKLIFPVIVVALVAGFFYLKISQTPEMVMEEPMMEEEMALDSMDEEKTYQDISPAEAQELIANNPTLVIIDVSPNYAQGHLPGAVNYYLGDGSLDKAIPDLDPTAMYLVYCHVDSVSIAGANKLIEAGFESVYRLEGNYSAWIEAGFEVEK